MIIFVQKIKPIINTTTAVLESEEYVRDKVLFFYANDIEEAKEKRMNYLESMEMYFREYISDLVEVCDSWSTATFGCCWSYLSTNGAPVKGALRRRSLPWQASEWSATNIPNCFYILFDWYYADCFDVKEQKEFGLIK